MHYPSYNHDDIEFYWAIIRPNFRVPVERKAAQEESPPTGQLDTEATLDFDTEINPYLSRIPSREADLITLYYVNGRTLGDIADIFGVTQAAISYRLDRGLQRVRGLLTSSV